MSPELVVTRIQPEGGVQAVGDDNANARVEEAVIVGSDATGVCVSVAGKPLVVDVGVGKLSGKVGGI